MFSKYYRQTLSCMCGNLYLIYVATHVYEIFCFVTTYVYSIYQLTICAKYFQNIYKWDLVLTVSSRKTQWCNQYS